jgi:carboxyl-terminal processing protease
MFRLTSVGNRRCWVGLLLAALVVTSLTAVAWADPVGPTSNDRHVTLAVTSLLRRDHLSKHPLDDEISRRALKLFLKMLDPMKVYFHQSDVDTFNLRVNDLDDMARGGDITFAYTVFRTFLKRIDEGVKLANECLAMEHDFTTDEWMVIDRDAAAYPRNEAEARDIWRKRIKYDLLVLKTDGIVGSRAIKKLTRRYRSYAKRMHQTDHEELLEMYLTAITTSFDPHTSYMSPSTQENFEIAMRLGLEGIGASLQAEDGYTVVRQIIRGGAAHKDGRLKVNDKIIAVAEGRDGEFVDVEDWKLSNVVKLIRGKRGTVVRLKVISEPKKEEVAAAEVAAEPAAEIEPPREEPEPKVIDITRAKIELKDSEARGVILEVGRKSDGTPYKIGVIDLPSFYMDMAGARAGLPDFKSATRDVRRILEEQFKPQGVDAVILDLRRNGGGSLTESINLTGLFIDQGPVVQVKDADKRVRGYDDLHAGTAWDGPFVVLISKFSASASEILAGAVQDYRRGLIVGDHATHGKGTVQSLSDLGRQLFRLPRSPKLGALKITMQQFYRPNGDSTQNRGVVSDVELPSLTTHLDIGEADLDYPVKFDRVDPRRFLKLDYVNKPMLDRLRDLSAKRCRDSEDFQKVLRNIARYKEQKGRKYVTLNEELFMAERAELNADKEQQKTIEEINDPDRPVFERNFYGDEALDITLDYLRIMQLAKAN